MNGYQGTFKRFEKKYLLSKAQYEELRNRLDERMRVDQYGETTICNIYFDTPNHQLIRYSMEKLVYKEKLRLRSYGTPTKDDMVFMELKKKYKGVVYKRREKVNLGAAEAFLNNSIPFDHESQIIKEIEWFLHFYKEIKPAMYISYDRIAMYGVEEPELRITFDRNILWRDHDLWLECNAWGNPLLKKGERLIEIKIPGAMPIWLSHILNDLTIFPTSFSKYGRSYEEAFRFTKRESRNGEIIYG